MTEKLLTPGEVAEQFRVSPASVRRWARNGKLRAIVSPAGKFLFNAAEIAALIAGENL